jgi:hypothetical protein
VATVGSQDGKNTSTIVNAEGKYITTLWTDLGRQNKNADTEYPTDAVRDFTLEEGMKVEARNGDHGVVTGEFKQFKTEVENGAMVHWTDEQSWWHVVGTGQFMRGDTGYAEPHRLDIVKILD